MNVAIEEVNVSLTVIRTLAAVFFIVFFLKSKERRHLVLFLGWLLYAVSAVLRGLVPLDPARYWFIVGLTTIGGVGLLMCALLAYLRSAVLRGSVPILVATAVAVLVAILSPRPIDDGIALYLIQAIFMITPVVVYVRLHREAERLFPGATATVVALLLSSVGYALFVAFVDIPLLVAATGTAVLNVGLVALFVFAEHEIVVAQARRTAVQLQRAEAAVGIGVWERDASGDHAVWSAGHYRLFGLTPTTQTAPSWAEYLSFVHPDDREYLEKVRKHDSTSGETELAQYRIVRPDGEVRWVSSRAVAVETGTIYGIIVDITALKSAEYHLEQLLKEKDSLIAEIQHRVKNNLQVVTSMFRLQFAWIRDPKVSSEIRRFNARLEAMAAAQGILLDSADVTDVDMDAYVRQLTEYIGVLDGVPSGAGIRADMGNVRLNTGTAIVVGSIISELVLAATDESRSATVDVRFEECDDCYRLTVSGGFDDASLEMALVRTYVSQLRGTVSVDSVSQRIVMTFPLGGRSVVPADE